MGPGLWARKALKPGRRVLALYGRFLLTLVSVNRRPTAVLAACLVFLGNILSRVVPGHVGLGAGGHCTAFGPEQIEVHLRDLGHHLLALHLCCVRGLLETMGMYPTQLTLAALFRVPLETESGSVLHIIIVACLVGRVQT